MLATNVRLGGLFSALLLLAGCPPHRKPEPVPIADAAIHPATTPAALMEPDSPPLEGCVDAWLEQHHLDRYGNAEGTMYAGGTPLFDERTGQTTDRMTYVFSKQPGAKRACAPDAGVPEGHGPATR